MSVFGGIGFTAPWLLLALLALPILWLILRAVPPAPIRRRFPGVALLLGLADDESTTDRTPWWLLLLRMLAVAAIIVGLAGPVLNPQAEAEQGSGPLLVVLDGNKGLYAAVTKALAGYVVVQRCQWHKRENVLEYLDKKHRSACRPNFRRLMNNPRMKRPGRS